MNSYPLATRLLGAESRRRHCMNCLRAELDTESQQLFRCGCCKDVYYCSKACQRKDWKTCHKLECGHYETWANALGNNTQNYDDLCLLVRTLLKIHTDDSSDCHHVRAWDGHGMHRPQPVQCGRLHWQSMEEASIWDTEEDKAQRTLIAQLASQALAKYGVTPEDALTAMRRFTANNFNVFGEMLSGYASTCNPFSALLNHSCAPNVVVRFMFSGNAEPPLLQFVAVTDITKGDELCHSYVDLTYTTSSRALQLKQKYNIDACNCVRCNGGALAPWPLKEDESVLSTVIDPFFWDECGADDAAADDDDDTRGKQCRH